MPTALDIMRRFAVLSAIAAPLLGASAQAAEMKTYQFFVRNGPVAGQEAEYNRFYDQEHAPDVVSIPGFVRAQRAVLSDEHLIPAKVVPPVPKYLVVYTIRTDDLQAVKAEIARRLTTGETRRSDTVDRTMADSFYYEVLPAPLTVPLREPTGAKPGPMQTYWHLVFTLPVEEKEAEFNTWYDQVHSPDMLKTAGIVAAQRGRLADPGRANPPPTKYIALFTMKTSDMSALARQFAADQPQRRRGDVMVSGTGYTYRLIGPELKGDDVRKARAARGK